MPYPKPVAIPKQRTGGRFADTMQSILKRLSRLEKRCASFDSGLPLNNLPGVVASVSPLMVTVNGAASPTGPYAHMASYAPAVGDSVLLAPCNATYSWYVIDKVIPA